MPALPATGAGEAMSEVAAFQIAAELALDVGWHRIAIDGAVARQRQSSREVGLHGAIEQRALGPPPAVRHRAVRGGLRHLRQLNIDPCTSNPVLRPLLDNVSRASFAGSFAINTAIGAVSMEANMVVSFDTDVREVVWNQLPVDLARQNESRLLATGVNARVVRDFLRNRWFPATRATSPSSGWKGQAWCSTAACGRDRLATSGRLGTPAAILRR